MSLPIEVVCIPAGRDSFKLTDLLDGQPTFSTVAVGGFADAAIVLRGDQRRRVPYLALIRIMFGADVLYEGQVEDVDPSGGPEDEKTTVTCFGLRNLLAENSVRRIWSKRDLALQVGTEIPGSSNAGITRAPTGALNVITGNYDPVDMSKSGVMVSGTSQTIDSPTPVSSGDFAEVFLPGGLFIAKILYDLILTGANCGIGKMNAFEHSLNTSRAVLEGNSHTASGSITLTTSPTAAGFRIGLFNNSGAAITPTPTDYMQASNIRVLGTTVKEDAAGGIYGGSVLRDLIALVPGLTIGVIEDGSDFTIQAIERAVRDSCQSVIDEVAGYYTREWAIWESGRFDWKTRQLDQVDWILTLPDVTSLSIQGTLDGLARTVYVLYTDAASGLDAEASAAATAQRNPYVKQGRAKDILVRPGFPMTSNTSQQLATRLAGDIGQWVPVQGTITLPATKIVPRALGSASPAAMIRAGDNVAITDLPKSDLFQQGRDGETLFHIVGTTCDLGQGTVTLQLEGQANRSDVLLARLAAVTRTLTQ